MHQRLRKVEVRATRWSLTRRLWCDDNLSRDVARMLWEGKAESLLFSSTPLQVKDRCIVVRHDHPSGALLIKQHTWGGLGRTLRSVGREMSARRCARLALQLDAAGIPTPLPRAYLENRVGPFGFRSYLVTDYIDGVSLYRYIRFQTQSPEELRHVARQVVTIWQELVEVGVSHNDMKPENFIVDKQRKVWLIDLEKMRLRGKARHQRRRNVCDVKAFLHVRGWRGRSEAREIFYNEFVSSRLGSLIIPRVPAAVFDPGLSVLIQTGPQPVAALVERAVDSVRDIADEAIIVSTSGGAVKVLDRITLLGEDDAAISIAASLPEAIRQPWTLLLQQDEIVTPFLAKEAQQHIAEPKGRDSFRIAVESQSFGQTIAVGKKDRPVRLYRTASCGVELDDIGELVVNSNSAPGHLTGLIQRSEFDTVEDFIDTLNERTTAFAEARWNREQRPSMTRAFVRALGRSIRSAASRRGIGSGWTGLQMALVEGAFVIVEEAKLRKLTSEFPGETGRGNGLVNPPSSASLLKLSSADADEQRRAA